MQPDEVQRKSQPLFTMSGEAKTDGPVAVSAPQVMMGFREASNNTLFRRSDSPNHGRPDLTTHLPSLTTGEEVFCRFVRSDVAVQAMFELAKKEKDLSLHFFILCAAFNLSGTAVRALVPMNLREKSSLTPLAGYLYHFQHTIGHSYLHSVVGTFVRLCLESFFPQDFIENIQSQRDLIATEERRKIVEQAFEYLMKMTAVSIPEIPEEIRKAFAVVYSSAGNDEVKRRFVLKAFLSDFISTGLATPEVALNMQIAPGMKAFCSLLASAIEVATTGREYTGRNADFINKLAKNNYVRGKIDLICSHLIEKSMSDNDELMLCYMDFLKIWEIFHHPCVRTGDRYTCTMREPSLQDSLSALLKFVETNSAEISFRIAQRSRMGPMSLHLEAFQELHSWLQGESKVAGGEIRG